MKHMQTCPQTPGHEVCPCTHTPLEPPHARQGINKETYPPLNKPPPRAPRRRPTTHVRILCSVHSRPFARRKEAWYEGYPYVTRKGGTTRHRRVHPRHKTHVPQAPRGTRRARGMPAHIYAAANNKRYGCTQQGPPRMKTHATPTRPAYQRNRHPFSFPKYAHPKYATAEDNVDTAKEHTKNKRPPTPRNRIRMV